ncbi:MAG: hypothetical protein N2037_03280 [Acidimicrobiales bacterium]|nr:hypothetical protein [Acidimicrobiales bacterium]
MTDDGSDAVTGEKDLAPPLGRRAVIIAVVVLGSLPLLAFATYTLVWRHAKSRSGPPGPEALYPLPEGVEVVEEGTGCEQGNYVPCWRVLVIADHRTPSFELASRLVTMYRQRGYELERQGASWATPCTGEPVCLLVMPLSEGRVRLEAKRMSDSL